MIQKTLYIHIGSHKTGTTSIQKALYDNKPLLEQHGFSSFDKIASGYTNLRVAEGSANSWVSCLNKSSIYDGCDIVEKSIFAKELSKLNGNVIVSTEKLFFVFRKEEIVKFKKELDKYFDKIIIIVYLRRQDKQIVSHYQGTTKYSNHLANFFFGDDAKALPDYKEHFDLYYDYNKKLIMYSEIFGNQNIIIRNYENLKNNDSVHDFFNIFNINISSSSKLNTSRGFQKVKLGHLIKNIPITSNHLEYNIFKNLDNKGKLIPSKDEAKAFYEKYKQSNYELNKKFKINNKEFLFDDDFSMYPNISADQWNEENTNSLIKNIFKGMNESYGTMNLNHLVNAAVKLEKIDVNLSYELLQIVSKLIPVNDFVNTKLQNYKQFLETQGQHIT